MFSKKVLDSGIRVITAPMGGVKSVTALVMVEAGSRYETEKINGITHILEHISFKGTKSRPSSLAITSLIDGIGGSFNAFTSKEYTGFYIKAASTHLPLLLDVLSDMLQNSLYDEGELKKEQGVIIEEINMYEDQPQAKVGELFERLLFPNNPLGWDTIGTKETVNSITRNDVVDYVRQMYHGKSMIITIAGDIGDAGAAQHDTKSGHSGRSPESLIDKYFNKITPGQENKYIRYAGGAQHDAKSLIKFKQTDQAHLCLGVRGYDINHPDKYVLDVMGTILGGNTSSRLFIEVREKRGLAYYVTAGSEEFLDCGYFMAQAGVKISAVEEAIKVILDEFIKMKNFDSNDELLRAKDFTSGKMALALEDSQRVAAFYASQELLRKKIMTPDEVLEKIEAVTAEDIKRVANDIFVDHNLNLSLIGPFKDGDKFDNILKL